MATSSKRRKEAIISKSISYKKELSWEIPEFEDWWLSRDLVQSERSKQNFSTWEEELEDEIPTNWSKASKSPCIGFEFNGVRHEFKLAVLKFETYDRFDNEYNEMMGISLFYNGPCDNVIVKLSFYITENGKQAEHSIEEQNLKKETFSNYRSFSSQNVIENKNVVYPANRLNVRCQVEINVLKQLSSIQNLKKNVATKKALNQRLLHDFDFKSDNSPLDQLSDFEIICYDKTDNGEVNEKHFRCHKLVLYLGSKYYQRMFSGNFSEIRGTTKVTDVSSETMVQVLKYMYSGEISKSDIDIDLLLAADKYELEHLFAICELELAYRISIETAQELSIAANLCGSEQFKHHTYSFVKENWGKIRNTKHSDKIRNNPQILSEILDKT